MSANPALDILDIGKAVATHENVDENDEDDDFDDFQAFEDPPESQPAVIQTKAQEKSALPNLLDLNMVS